MGEVAGRQAFPTNGRVTNEIPLHLTKKSSTFGAANSGQRFWGGLSRTLGRSPLTPLHRACGPADSTISGQCSLECNHPFSRGAGKCKGAPRGPWEGTQNEVLRFLGGGFWAGQAIFLTVSVENSEGVRNKTPGATTLRVLAPFGMEFSGRESLRTHASIYKPHAMKKASNEGPCSALAEVRTHSPRPELAASKVPGRTKNRATPPFCRK
jgi:hypothetical protein